MLCCPGTFIILIESQFEVFQPLDLLVAVVLGAFGADHVLDDDAAVLMEFIAPIAVCAGAEIHEIFDGEGLVGGRSHFLNSGA